MNDDNCCETCKWWFPNDPEEATKRKSKGLTNLGMCQWHEGRDIPSCIENPEYWQNYDDCGGDCSCWEPKTI